MSKFVSRSIVLRNGNKVPNLKSFEKDAVKFAGTFKSMDGGGTFDMNVEHLFTVNYVIPKAGAKIDWSDVQDEKWTIELVGGNRIEYTGVDFLEEGKITVDGENEVVMPLMFRAESRTIR